MRFFVSNHNSFGNIVIRTTRPRDERIARHFTEIESPTAVEALAEFTNTKIGTRKKAAEVEAPKLPAYGTVAVRFIYGYNLEKKYTYRVREKGHKKLTLGQEIIVPSPDGPKIAVVVEIHNTPQDNLGFDYKFAVGTISSF